MQKGGIRVLRVHHRVQRKTERKNTHLKTYRNSATTDLPEDGRTDHVGLTLTTAGRRDARAPVERAAAEYALGATECAGKIRFCSGRNIDGVGEGEGKARGKSRGGEEVSNNGSGW
uniref:Uncharacterized protein n=1 Tax=Sipha flava TaxID=143950 RepID=A0A2S2QDA9_9HEMI